MNLKASLPPILVVDDEPSIRSALNLLLSQDYEVLEAADGETALGILNQQEVGVVLLDLAMPGLSGEEVLKAIKAAYPMTEVVLVTAVRSVEQAVSCMKAGAYDFLSKPWDAVQLKALLKRAMEKWELARENQLLRSQQLEAGKLSAIILGSSSPMAQVREVIAKVAAHDSTVLITGESGTGKELVAASIHSQSKRRQGRFVAVACSAIPAELVESELFGHEKGAFSSAISTRIGKFEYASGGTLFLDDVATLPLEAQAKLLRALQEREITRLGSNRLIPVDVRVISSTNQELGELVRRSQFREDLYWRLCGVPIALPPLRERGNDVAELLDMFVLRICERYRKKAPRISPEIYKILQSHSFPGNVRELANLAETLVVLCEGDEINPATLPVQLLLNFTGGEFPVQQVPFKKAMQEFERQLISKTLATVGGNQTLAAKKLGIHRNTLLIKMQELGLKE